MSLDARFERNWEHKGRHWATRPLTQAQKILQSVFARRLVLVGVDGFARARGRSGGTAINREKVPVMSQQERQMFAVAQNLRSLARLHADAQRYPTALALYDESLKWAKRAEGLPHTSDFVQVLTREQSALRQQETMAQAAAVAMAEDLQA